MRALTTIVLIVIGCFLARPAFPCGGDCSCDWGNPNVTYHLSETKDGLLLLSIVHGCPALKAAHIQKLEAEVSRAQKGETCARCPFGVKGLSYKVEQGEVGAIVYITGDKSNLEEFKSRFEKKMAKRQDAQGCGCPGHGSDGSHKCPARASD